MESAELMDLFARTSDAVRDSLADLRGKARRARTSKPGQYELDLIADRAALDVLGQAPVTVLSEESGVTGNRDAEITVVLDPVDGSSNAARDLPYWATSLCALDRDGPYVAMVVNHAIGSASTAVRGQGAFKDGLPLTPSAATRVEDAVVAISSLPGRVLAWKQFRALGSCALALCDVASGAFDGYLDGGSFHAPWDYLGGLLVCSEARAFVDDARSRPLAVPDAAVRRQIVAAGTERLLGDLRSAAN